MTSPQKPPLFSVIMPAYNAEKYLVDAIHSVQAQTENNWELLIINDGSTDQTEVIAKGYTEQDPRIQLLSQKNQGVSVARNTGIEHARGQYVSFIDSDDLYHPTFLEDLYTKIKDTAYDLVYSGILVEKEQYVQGEPYPEMNILMAYAKGIVRYIGFTSTLYRLDFLNRHQIRFPIGCSVGEDQEFLMHCGIYAQVGSVPKILYHYRWNQDSVINTMSPEKVHIDLAGRKRTTEMVERLYQGVGKKEIIHFLKSWEDRIITIFANLVVQRIKKGEYQEALQEVRDFGAIPYCWRRKSMKQIKRAFILNTQSIAFWQFLWGKKK